MQNKARRYARALMEALEEKTQKEAERIVKRLKQLLKRRGDLRLIYQIEKEFINMETEKEGMSAEVVTASVLSDQARGEIEQSLEKRGFKMRERVEPDVIGGTAIFLGKEQLIDGTIRGRLNRIAKLTHG
ncbi:F0F1 ATP synthase subunit delta [Patescibacteria group bacterium]|nr:F0F1 ATP synthase subunit delta [Patescibacteria group bacterium]